MAQTTHLTSFGPCQAAAAATQVVAAAASVAAVTAITLVYVYVGINKIEQKSEEKKHTGTSRCIALDPRPPAAL